jgi:hypothetical protein
VITGSRGDGVLGSILKPGSQEQPTKAAAGDRDSKQTEPAHSHHSVAAVDTDSAELFAMLDSLMAVNKDEMARHSVLPAAGSTPGQETTQAPSEAHPGAHILQQHIRRHRKSSSFAEHPEIPGEIPAEGSVRPQADGQREQQQPQVQVQLQRFADSKSLKYPPEDKKLQQYDSYAEDKDELPQQQPQQKYQEKKPWKQIEDFGSKWLGDAVGSEPEPESSKKKYTEESDDDSSDDDSSSDDSSSDDDSSDEEAYEEPTQKKKSYEEPSKKKYTEEPSEPGEKYSEQPSKKKYSGEDEQEKKKSDPSFEKYINDILGDSVTKDLFGLDEAEGEGEADEHSGKYQKPTKADPPKGQKDLTYPPKGQHNKPTAGDTLGDDDSFDSSDQGESSRVISKSGCRLILKLGLIVAIEH